MCNDINDSINVIMILINVCINENEVIVLMKKKYYY